MFGKRGRFNLMLVSSLGYQVLLADWESVCGVSNRKKTLYITFPRALFSFCTIRRLLMEREGRGRGSFHFLPSSSASCLRPRGGGPNLAFSSLPTQRHFQDQPPPPQLGSLYFYIFFIPICVCVWVWGEGCVRLSLPA